MELGYFKQLLFDFGRHLSNTLHSIFHGIAISTRQLWDGPNRPTNSFEKGN